MTSVLGVLGALSMIASVAFGTVLAIAEGYEQAAREGSEGQASKARRRT
jgi:hypothetical protein